ncbi:response regulator transcription factor [Paenibacillus roseipurpureus]|uniref:Response regulator n=1 Tax=Paenibacillus roseopurpureus TaxID=2918901 RepID=A0AA96RKA7_9BACL|nr:response regulator [Paenibacillus sp. MBLB1832]WNR46143.1 response regulator [Paenibacillus sp. MBLB1832]
MIEALIVDDEYIVRKGLVHMFPWEEFGIRIAGEAPNGAKALEFMENHTIQLLITDISMPIMDGFELIKAVKPRYEHLAIVVLTCHQDFHYVQDALRLGAIDYIVKTELENDTLHQSISRFVMRVKEQAANRNEVGPAQEPEVPIHSESWGLLLTPLRKGAGLSEVLALTLESAAPLMLPDGGCFIPSHELKLGYRDKERILDLVDGSSWVITILHNLRRNADKSTLDKLNDYWKNKLFYEYTCHTPVYEVDWHSLNGERKPSPEANQALHQLTQQWKSFLWVYDDNLFRQMVQDVKERQSPAAAWKEVLQQTVSLWRHLVAIDGSANWHVETSALYYWEQWVDWLSLIRPKLRRQEFSDEVCISILRAIHMIRQDIHLGINQSEVAAKVKITRSYFSHCFKQYAGQTFQEVINDIRVERACELLLSTQEPVYRIAEQVGFDDDKYFSKFFKQQTGMLPSNVRKV